MNTKVLNEIKEAMKNKDILIKSVKDKALLMAKDVKLYIPTDDMYNQAF